MSYHRTLLWKQNLNEIVRRFDKEACLQETEFDNLISVFLYQYEEDFPDYLRRTGFKVKENIFNKITNGQLIYIEIPKFLEYPKYLEIITSFFIAIFSVLYYYVIYFH